MGLLIDTPLPRARAAVLLVALTISSSACSPHRGAQPGGGSPEGAALTSVRETVASWARAMDSGPADEIVRYFADDVVAMYPKPQPTIGRAANRAAWESAFARPHFHHPLATDTVVVAGSGELAYALGRWRTRWDAPNGAAMEHGGRFVTVWRRVGADWRIAVLAATVNEPPPPVP